MRCICADERHSEPARIAVCLQIQKISARFERHSWALAFAAPKDTLTDHASMSRTSSCDVTGFRNVQIWFYLFELSSEIGIETTASTWHIFIFRLLITVDDITCYSFKLKNTASVHLFHLCLWWFSFLHAFCFLLGSFFVFVLGFGGQL